MWDKLIKEIAKYPSLVLCWTDTAGYPYSVRFQPEVDSNQKIIRLKLPDMLPLRATHASIMSHFHDDGVSNQTSMGARGMLEQDSQGWFFRPTALIPGLDNNPFKMLPVVLKLRSTAKKYLEKRGIARPQIDWASFESCKPQKS